MLWVIGGCYPVWQSLACDYMAIMASSVSSKRAFLSAGITISKQCNCPDADIVEALQCLKSFIHEDIMVREFATVAEEEKDMNYLDEQLANQDLSTSNAVRWDDDDLSIGQLFKANNDIDGDETDILSSQA